MFMFNPEQENVINNAVNHIKNDNEGELVYQFSGKAGTGKTTVIKEIIRRIGIPEHRVAVMTYIGQASIVLRTKGIMNAKTIHSWIYYTEEVPVYKNGYPVMDPVYNKPVTKMVYRKKKKLEEIDYIIIDEAYTVPIRMRKDIESFGLKIIACGDSHQLPPVGDEPAFLVDGHIDYLNINMRQGEGSGILKVADYLYNGYNLSTGFYGDVLVIDDKDLTPEMIKYANIMICATNATRDELNYMTRHELLHIQQNAKIPLYGEKIICRKNEWNTEVNGVSLANGLIGSVISDVTPSKLDRKRKEFILDFKPDLFNGIFQDVHCDYDYFIADSATRQTLKNNPYSRGSKFEFAYAITTHLSQGAQYPQGIYFKEYFRKDLQANLDYTGPTRFTKFLIIVLHSKHFF